MKTYRVEFAMSIDAESSSNAAEKVFNLLRTQPDAKFTVHWKDSPDPDAWGNELVYCTREVAVTRL